ncbi:hypothetical protein [Sporosarcina gallistercoris]
MVKYQNYTRSVASVYPCYFTKTEKKGCTKTGFDEIDRGLKV